MPFNDVKHTLHNSVLEKLKCKKLKNQKYNVTDEKLMIKTRVLLFQKTHNNKVKNSWSDLNWRIPKCEAPKPVSFLKKRLATIDFLTFLIIWPILVKGLFLQSLKTSENLWFSKPVA